MFSHLDTIRSVKNRWTDKQIDRQNW